MILPNDFQQRGRPGTIEHGKLCEELLIETPGNVGLQE